MQNVKRLLVVVLQSNRECWNMIMTGHVVNNILIHTLSGLSLKAEGQDFLPRSMT